MGSTATPKLIDRNLSLGSQASNHVGTFRAQQGLTGVSHGYPDTIPELETARFTGGNTTMPGNVVYTIPQSMVWRNTEVQGGASQDSDRSELRKAIRALERQVNRQASGNESDDEPKADEPGRRS